MKKLGFINEHNFSKAKIKKLPINKKSRGVVFKNKNTILCVEETFLGIKHLLGLPGGTLDKGESHMEAFKREILEETGYKIKNIKPIGYIDNVRSKYVSHVVCYKAETVGKKKRIKLTEEEISVETKSLEMNIDKAIQKIKSQYKNSPNDSSLRSLMILNEVIE